MAGISIAVVDDHPLLLEGLSALLRRKAGFSLVGVGACADHILQISETYRPDAMIVDLNIPGDAFQAISDALTIAPAMKIIVFTASTNTDYAILALDAGASGYVLKGCPSDDLFAAIEAACRGEIYLAPSFASKVIGALQTKALEKWVTLEKRVTQSTQLSAREDQIVRLLICGKQDREIAHALSLSEKTVNGYMTNLMHKLNARNRFEVVVAAQKLASNAPERRRLTALK